MYTLTGTVIEVVQHDQFKIERADDSQYVQVCVCVCVSVCVSVFVWACIYLFRDYLQ